LWGGCLIQSAIPVNSILQKISQILPLRKKLPIKNPFRHHDLGFFLKFSFFRSQSRFSCNDDYTGYIGISLNSLRAQRNIQRFAASKTFRFR